VYFFRKKVRQKTSISFNLKKYVKKVAGSNISFNLKRALNT